MSAVVGVPCYCDPSMVYIGCNEKACMAIAAIYLVFFFVPLCVTVYRLVTIKKKRDNSWSLVSHILIMICCVLRIVRSGCLLAKVWNITGMAFLFLIPIGFLICSYFSTLFVWIKIIHHVNFSKFVEKVFPFLGKTTIVAQFILMVLLFIGSFVYWSFYATNAILGFYLFSGAVGFGIFGRMIWREYKDVSNKDCGVFSDSTHAKIQKVTKLSAAAILVSALTFGLIVWSFIKPIMPVETVIAFSFIGRSIEVLWIASMLFILSPSLQTWNHNSQRMSSGAEHFDDLSDSSIDIENEKEMPSQTPMEVQAKSTESVGGSDI